MFNYHQHQWAHLVAVAWSVSVIVVVVSAQVCDHSAGPSRDLLLMTPEGTRDYEKWYNLPSFLFLRYKKRPSQTPVFQRCFITVPAFAPTTKTACDWTGRPDPAGLDSRAHMKERDGGM